MKLEINPLNLPLSRLGIDRATELRSDLQLQERLWESAKIIHFAAGRFRTSQTESLDFLTAHQVTELTSSSNTGSLQFSIGSRYFLGLDDEIPYFVWHSTAVDIEQFPEYRSLREIGSTLSDDEVGLAVHAQALANWHESHPRCPRCGAHTQVGMAGATRVCIEDKSEHHPRTDPAVIVLIRDEHDRILLGRQKVWPEHRFSTFAGFVEPGESFEQSVRREMREEAGVEVTEIRYLGSQPWPFPASLMIAFECIALDHDVAKADGSEIEEVRWLSRDEMKEAIHHRRLLLPPRISVARAMIEAWYGPYARRDLSGGETWRN